MSRLVGRRKSEGSQNRPINLTSSISNAKLRSDNIQVKIDAVDRELEKCKEKWRKRETKLVDNSVLRQKMFL
jgi:hypothetical protein